MSHINAPVLHWTANTHGVQHTVSDSGGDESDEDQPSSEEREYEGGSIKEIKCMLQLLCKKVEQNERTLMELQNMQRCRLAGRDVSLTEALCTTVCTCAKYCASIMPFPIGFVCSVTCLHVC